MPERKGSAHARGLFNKSIDATSLDEWKMYDRSYDRALQVLSEESKRSDLVELDNYVHIELPTLILSRSPPHLIHHELAQVMKWKLTRGKFRPLQKLVESNTSISVVDASTQCFRLLAKGDWEAAFDAITQLRGVGVATASAICSIIAPNDCPFMADEVLEAVTSETREYSMRAYSTMRQALMDKAKELQEGWNADRVGRAMWTCAIVSANQQSTAGKKRNIQSTTSTAISATSKTVTSEVSDETNVEESDIVAGASSSSSRKKQRTAAETSTTNT